MREGAQSLARASISERSAKNYDGNFRKWRNFLEEADALVDPQSGNSNEFLDFEESDADRVALLNEFIYYVRTYSNNKGTTIAATLSGIKHIFAVNRKRTEIFDDAILGMSKTGCRMLDGKEGRNRQDEEDKRVPFTIDMILIALDHYANQPSVMLHSIATCFVLAYFGCLRVSNYVPMPGSEHHAITASEITFVFNGGIKRTAYELATRGGNPTRDELMFVNIFVASSKGDRFRKGRQFIIPASGLVAGAFNAAYHLMQWAAMAGYASPGDLFVSFNGFMPNTPRQEPSYVIMMEEVKQWARKFNIPVHKAGTHCFRIGAATQMDAGELEKKEIRDHGDWRTESSCVLYKKNSMAQARRVYNVLAEPGIYTDVDRQIESNKGCSSREGIVELTTGGQQLQVSSQQGGCNNGSKTRREIDGGASNWRIRKQ